MGEVLALPRAVPLERRLPALPAPGVVALLLPLLLQVHLQLRVFHPLVLAVVLQELLLLLDPEAAALPRRPHRLPVHRQPHLPMPGALSREACLTSRGLWS